ncbi:MAG: RES family NAD+ phosphorylase [Candidatus Aminicenantes bacterium]|jgi:RES domain-containing protein
MLVYRIAKKKHIRDFSGIGARLYGGRWNRKGIGIVYTSESRALSLVEFLVNVPFSILPNKLCIATVEIDNQIHPIEISPDDLPKNWYKFPASSELAEIGSKWAVSNESLALRVPSAVVPHEFNTLINPSHPDMKHVAIADVEEFEMDKRLF